MANYPPQRDQYGRYDAPSGPRFTVQASRISGSPRGISGAVVAWVTALISISVLGIIWVTMTGIVVDTLSSIGVIAATITPGGVPVSGGTIAFMWNMFMVLCAIGICLAALINSLS